MPEAYPIPRLDPRPASPYLVCVRHAPTNLLLALAALLLPGCLERTIRVTSTPPGALVWLNDVEIGHTPAEARFKFYGTYDVRVELPGYEPVHEGRDAKAPFYEYPGPDFVAAALPNRIQNTVEWHFDLTASPGINSPDAQAAIIARALALRERLGPAPAPVAAPAPPADAAATPSKPPAEQTPSPSDPTSSLPNPPPP